MSLIQRLLDPIITVLLLVGLCQIWGEVEQIPYWVMATTTFLLMLPILKLLGLYRSYRSLSPSTLAPRLLTGWLMVIGSLLFLGFLTQTSAIFSRSLLLT